VWANPPLRGGFGKGRKERRGSSGRPELPQQLSSTNEHGPIPFLVQVFSSSTKDFGRKRKRFSVEQIVRLLKQAEAGVPAASCEFTGTQTAGDSPLGCSQEVHRACPASGQASYFFPPLSACALPIGFRPLCAQSPAAAPPIVLQRALFRPLPPHLAQSDSVRILLFCHSKVTLFDLVQKSMARISS